MIYFFDALGKEKVIEEMVRVCEPGGTVCIGVKNYDFLVSTFGKNRGVFFLVPDEVIADVMQDKGLHLRDTKISHFEDEMARHKHLFVGQDDQSTHCLLGTKHKRK